MPLFCSGDDCQMATLNNPASARMKGWRVHKDLASCPACRKAPQPDALELEARREQALDRLDGRGEE